jgi:hypothetical protein
LPDPILKNPITKRAGGVAHCVGPEFKPQYVKKEKKKKEKKRKRKKKERKGASGFITFL